MYFTDKTESHKMFRLHICNDHNEEMCQTFSMCIYNKEELIVVQFVSAVFFM